MQSGPQKLLAALTKPPINVNSAWLELPKLRPAPPDMKAVFKKYCRAGFAEEIIPDIPVGATMSPASSVLPNMLGKTPGIKKSDGTWTGRHGPWKDELHPVEADVIEWWRWGANLGLQGRKFPMVDIDCDDPELARQIEEFAVAYLGQAPVRERDGTARRLLLYALAEGSPPVLKGRLSWIDAEGRKQAVDILGYGQQACLEGAHPKGGYYRWRNEKGPCEWGHVNIIRVSAERMIAFQAALKGALETKGYTVDATNVATARKAAASPSKSGGKVRDLAASTQRGDLAPSKEALEDLLHRRLPNTRDREDRNEIVGIISKVRVAAGEHWPKVYSEIVLPWALNKDEWPENTPEWVEHICKSNLNEDKGWSALCRKADYEERALLDDAAAEYDPGDPVPPEEVFSDPVPAEFLPEPPRRDAPPAAAVITANPFVWRDPKTIPPRQWLYGKHCIRRYLSATIAPGGLGKSALTLVEAVAMATGRDLLSVNPTERCRVWVINLEDPLDELERRIVAICLHYNVPREELDGHLFVNSGRDASICLARDHRGELVLNKQTFEQLRETIGRNKIDAVILDPFIGAHLVSENDNTKIKAVCHRLTLLAEETNCAIGLVHHVRKPAQGQGETTANDARGAGALVDATRITRVLNRMTKEEAARCGIEKPGYFVRVTNGKLNLTPPGDERSEWYRLVNVPLGNGKSPSEPGDEIVVVTAWAWPDPSQELSDAEIEAIQERVRTGEWRADTRAKKWVGHAVAEVMGFDPAEPSARAAMKKIVNTLVQIGALKIGDRMDEHRELKKFVEVGKKWEVEEW